MAHARSPEPIVGDNVANDVVDSGEDANGFAKCEEVDQKDVSGLANEREDSVQRLARDSKDMYESLHDSLADLHTKVNKLLLHAAPKIDAQEPHKNSKAAAARAVSTGSNVSMSATGSWNVGEQVLINGSASTSHSQQLATASRGLWSEHTPEIDSRDIERKLKHAGTGFGSLNPNRKSRETQVHIAAAMNAQSVQLEMCRLLEERDRLSRFVLSGRFDQISALLVLSNSLFLGVQIEFAFTNETFDSVLYVDIVFCVLFLIELLLRVYAFGCRGFFTGYDRHWNWFDLAIVGLTTIDVLVSIVLSDSNISLLSNISILRTLRILRITRVLRIIRVMKFFKELRVMISAIASTLKVACWALALLVMAMYIFGTAIASLVAERIVFIENSEESDDAGLRHYFGSLAKTLFTLFMAVAGGIDWEAAYGPLVRVGVFAQSIFLSYILFASFCVMNVIIGIFCQNATEAFESDKEKVIEDQLRGKKKYVDSLVDLFQHIDKDDSNHVSLEEFERGIDDFRMQAILRTLDIERRDALALFEMLDMDSSGDVNIEEFISGCINFRGMAKAVQVEKIAVDCRIVARQVAALQDAVITCSHALADIPAQIARTFTASTAHASQAKYQGKMSSQAKPAEAKPTSDDSMQNISDTSSVAKHVRMIL
jgi:voltage-gated sodium channel